MWLAYFPNFDQDGVLCQGHGRPDDLVATNFDNAFGVLRHLQGRLILARAFGIRLKKLFGSLLQCKTLYNNPAGNSPTEMKVSNSLKAYLEMEKDHKEFGDEITETDNVSYEEAPDVRYLVNVYKTENAMHSNQSPVVAKSEVKNETGTSSERAPEPHATPPETHSFNAVNSAGYAVPNHTSPSNRHYSSNYYGSYPSADRSSSLRVALESQSRPYDATSGHPIDRAEPIAAGTVDHHSIHAGAIPPVYHTPNYYPNQNFELYLTQGQNQSEDIQDVWTANVASGFWGGGGYY